MKVKRHYFNNKKVPKLASLQSSHVEEEKYSISGRRAKIPRQLEYYQSPKKKNPLDFGSCRAIKSLGHVVAWKFRVSKSDTDIG